MIEGMTKRKLFSGQGRKRLTGKREPNGQLQRASRPEREKDVMAVALAQPHRRGERSALAGYALGRLFMHQQISLPQFHAGESYTRLAVRYMRDVTGSLPVLPSAMADRIASGISSGLERDEDDIYAMRRDYQNAMRCLADIGEFQTGNAILMSVCILDKDPRTDAQMGSLRASLNALHRMWSSERRAA